MEIADMTPEEKAVECETELRNVLSKYGFKLNTVTNITLMPVEEEDATEVTADTEATPE